VAGRVRGDEAERGRREEDRRACEEGGPLTVDVETPSGLARAHLRRAEGATAALVLGHGAGGGIGAPDLNAAAKAAFDLRLTVALVEQPYRVAGRRSPAPAPQLDAAWVAVVAALQAHGLEGLRLLVGGRSSGARVACRTAAATGAAAVLCLAFPLQPPRRTGAATSRQPELDAVRVPTLVVQGTRDPFGMPAPGRRRKVVEVPGDHSLKADLPAVSRAVHAWLARQARPARVLG
jgi:predicted alpha/beta-hydrolase family hydrolase